ncbi:formylglycine-generating enzyme family protein, partial [bacterium]
MQDEAQVLKPCCHPGGIARSIENSISLLQIQPQKSASTVGMIHLEGGKFLMGSEGPEAWAADGEGPVREVTVAPFWMDACTVTNAQFAQFIEATGYKTEAESFGWSYVFHKHVSSDNKKKVRGFSGEAQWWLGIEGAFWRRPEGPGSDIKKRLDHPVVHVSWNDAQAYCN